MTLITVDGVNPFSGQSDPYLSLDSNITYGTNGESEVNNSYLLEGTITGCSKHSLITYQNKIVNHFDWKLDREITEKINIIGVVSASKKARLIPTSLSFESSNYIGSLGYVLQIDMFTGFGSDDVDPDSINLIDKTHNQTKTIDSKGCIKISTNISCAPNPNMTGCGAIEAANKWVSDRLGIAQIGNVTSQSDLTLDSESLTIHPITSAISYSSNSSDGCNNSINDSENSGRFETAMCSEIVDDNPDCPNSTKTETIRGEIYDPSGTPESLMSYLKSDVIDGNIHNLSADYSDNSLSFSYEKIDPNAPKEPEDYILYDETVSSNINHDEGSRSINVNGTISLLNPINKTSSDVLNITNQRITSKANSSAEGLSLLTHNITKNLTEGTVNYNYSYSSDDKNGGDNETPRLMGVSGLSNFSVSYVPSLEIYKTIQNLNCDDFVVRTPQISRGKFNINLTAQSGEGYNFGLEASGAMQRWKNFLRGSASDFVVEDESSNFSNCGTSLSMQVSANFIKRSAISNGSSIISMY